MRSTRYHGERFRAPGTLLGGTLAALAVAVVAAVRLGPFRAAIEGASMEPTFRRGDWVVVTRRGRLRRGAVVVVEHPERPGHEMVKRVGAVGGDRVAGRVLDPEQLWVVGERPEASTDSRHFGPVSTSAVLGVVRFRYRRGPRPAGEAARARRRPPGPPARVASGRGPRRR